MPASPLRDHWGLDPGLAFLNHGSFGACPLEVLEFQTELRERLERQPVRFMVRELEGLMDGARAALARFLGAAPDDLVYVPNATVGVNSVLRSMRLGPGDELLTTSHAYNACVNVLRFVAERAGARVRVVDVPVPVRDEDALVGRVLDAVNGRTRLALLDHVSSPTAIVWPIGRLVRELRDRGVETLVDGAHGPGMIDVDLGALGAACYTGNLHKWVCAPKGAGFLWVRPDLQGSVRPAIISHGANSTRTDRSRFQIEFGWTGTDDPTASLCVPRALEVVGGLVPGGWPEVRARNRALALEGRRILAGRVGLEPVAPEEMVGSIASLVLPDGGGPPPTSALYRDPLQDRLIQTFGVEVPIVPWPEHPRRLVRISAQLYNDPSQYERLAEGLLALLPGR
jgi:isopenicillin-N epimerase